MTTNRLKAKLREGQTTLGGWSTLTDSFAAEMVGNLEVDYTVIDMQHGVASYPDLIAILQGIGVGGATPLLRVPVSDFGLAQRALDAGVEGLLIPLVDNAEDAVKAVNACRYPPLGKRSYGPIRARMHIGSDPEAVNDEILCLVQIETPGAMENLEAIVGTEGLDGVYVGPADLAIAHGLPIGTEDPRMEEMLASIVKTCQEGHVIAGIHAFSGKAARRATERGFSMVSVGSDATWLRAGYSRELAIARGHEPIDVVGFY